MKQKKLITMILSGVLTIGLTGNIAKATSVDQLYKCAYNSMLTAQKEKTQVSINKARVAINALPTSMKCARGTFSRAVDKVQQPIFVKIVDLIMDARKAPTQDKINKGKALLEGVQPCYANSWSSALDDVQNILIKKTINAIDNSILNDTETNRLAANDMLKELNKSTNKDLINYTNILSDMYKHRNPINVTTNRSTTTVITNSNNTTTTITTITENNTTTTTTTITNNNDGSIISNKVVVTTNN